MYTISSNQRLAKINPVGAELTSIVSRFSNEEYMWVGDDTIWAGHAPILFPIIGGLVGGEMRAKGQTWQVPKHGLVRRREFSCEQTRDNQLVCTLDSSPETMACYPWQFRLKVRFTLEECKLLIDYFVENLDAEKMLFNIGSHPAFSLPVADATLDEYLIRFDQPENLDRYFQSDNLMKLKTEPVSLEDNSLRITPTMFDDDVWVFMGINSTQLTLEHRPKGTCESAKRVQVDTGGAPHLGVWSKPAAPYVCIEPWWGVPDFENASGDFSKKSSIQSLPAGEIFEHRIAITTFDKN